MLSDIRSRWFLITALILAAAAYPLLSTALQKSTTAEQCQSIANELETFSGALSTARKQMLQQSIDRFCKEPSQVSKDL